jgi:hypothetical protein
MSTGLPFTAEAFFESFATYNRLFWPVAAGLWLAAIGAVAVTWRNPVGRSRLLTGVIAILWAWGAVAYHAFLFTRINPAAWLFAGLFALQAALLLRAAADSTIRYFAATGARRAGGLFLAAYGILYPFLSLLAQPYPRTPTFGVPCPTTLLTIGVLMTLRGAIPIRLALIPALWGVVGGSAAVLLGVPTDYVLLGSGMFLSLRLLAQGTGLSGAAN